MHIGLIGGIGPAATLAYYRKLVAAFRGRGAVLNLTIANADVLTLARHAEADDRLAQAKVYAGHLAQLKGAGADFATITSIGGHFCFAETAALTPLPLVSAITPVDTGLAARGIGRIGLLGTRQVMTSGLYGQLGQTVPITPEDIDTIHESYIAMAKSGVCTDAARALFLDQGQRLMDRGADAVLLAGTDLTLAFDGQVPGYPVIDAVDLHVEALVRLGTGEVGLDPATPGL